MPFLVALTVCAFTSVVLGFSAWFAFGKNPAVAANKPSKVLAEAAPQMSVSPATRPDTPPDTAAKESAPPPDTVSVTGGTVELGARDANTPARKVAVEPFYIADTEVTNEQYQEFVKDSKSKAPAGWKNDDFPDGTASEPVTGITWQNAVDFCNWLSTKKGLKVRLPSEAEWELAARGPEGSKYPWGNEWNDRAAASDGKAGFVHAVKSYPAGRAACGAYDLAGNVWELVADTLDAEGKVVTEGEAPNRVIKGGAANEQRALISATSRNIIPKNYAGAFVGFRYVVVKN
ncbi:MAG TPA: SUMF1/EgtB/PvdO family nonheme iron enzyme [Pyrinomonadaceae bacterium]|nr:SUMF1/EgtB/PvdO family nonheme iron enzyme [Pyrinomonadaceae bacterium]